MRNRSLVPFLLLSLLASTAGAGAGENVYFRGTSHVILQTEDGVPGTGTNTEIGVDVDGSRNLSYGGEWDLLIEATNAASYSMALASALPPGIRQEAVGSGIRLVGRTYEGTFDLSVSVLANGRTSVVPAGAVTVAGPAAPLAIAPSRPAATFFPSQDWDLVFAASGGLAPYVFLDAVGLPSSVSATAGSTSASTVGRAPVGRYSGVSLLVEDAAGRRLRSSAVDITVVGSAATTTPATQLRSDAVRSATPPAPAATFSVANAGPAPSGVVAVTQPIGAGNFLVGGTCASGASVPAGGSCTVTLTRTPGVLDDVASGSFSVAFANGGTGAGTVVGSASGYVPSIGFPAGAGSLTAEVGTPWSFDFDAGAAKNNLGSTPLVWSSSDRPAWMSIATATGLGTGTPTTKGTASFEVVAANDRVDGRKVFTIVVGGATLKVVQVSVGGSHACAVTVGGGLKCWGNDSNGQLGNDTATTGQPTPVGVSGLASGVSSVSAGANHTCAVTTGGALKCWGYDGFGQLGDDAATTNQPTPVGVSGLGSGVSSVAAGSNHTCAVATGGALKCWGTDGLGQLGDDVPLVTRPTPVGVSGLGSGVASVAAGDGHTCAVATGGAVKCWGADFAGQLGNDAATTDQPTPVGVSGLGSGASAVSVGANHSCAVATGGALKCWGYDNNGQLGNDAATTSQPTPVGVAGLGSGVSVVAAGGNTTCAVATGGDLKCWGNDNSGQLGNDAALTSQPTPVGVAGLGSGVSAVAAGGNTTCAVATGGALKCWGRDAQGQLGDDAALMGQPMPVGVSGL